MRGELLVLNGSGHARYPWDTEDKMTIEEVRRRFEDLVARSYLTYALDSEGNAAQIRSFDEAVTAERVVAHAPLVGG